VTDKLARILQYQRDRLLTALEEVRGWVGQLEQRFDLTSPGDPPLRLDSWLAVLRWRLRRLTNRLWNVHLAPGAPRVVRTAVCDWPPCQQPFTQPARGHRMCCSDACKGKRKAWMIRNRLKVFGLPKGGGRTRTLRLRELMDFDPNL